MTGLQPEHPERSLIEQRADAAEAPCRPGGGEDARPVRLLLEGITKRFPGVVANDDVTFGVRAGEIHALLGENGAGKTTLMEIAYGVYRPDAGRVVVDGSPLRLRSPKDAMDAGIGMVHQHFMLVPILSVAANIALELRTGRPILNLAPVAARIEELSQSYGLHVHPWAKVEELSVGELQRVEIMKALYRDAQILILDEPTSLLAPIETEQLFRVMRDLCAEGRSIVFISHKLEEVMAVADRISVLRYGKLQAMLPRHEADERLLARLMVGERELDALAPVSLESRAPGKALIRMQGVSVVDRKRPLLRDVELEVEKGEIVGVAGVEGNGQRELAEVLVSLTKPSAGSIEICGRDIRDLSHSDVVDLGVGFIPEDRQEAGLVLDFTIEENVFLRRQRRTGLTARGFVNQRGLRRLAARLMEEFGIAAPSPRLLVKKLSGGNQQKVILARELYGKPNVIVASQPTRGLDIAATSYVHELLARHRARGAAIVLISTNLDEILELSDRIAVLYEGRVVGALDAATATREQVGLLMAGRAA